MIELTITDDQNGREFARVRLQLLQINTADETADYSVEFAVERGSAIGLHRRAIFGFPYQKYNVLALLRQALDSLDEKELELEHSDKARTSNLARRERGVGEALQAWANRLRNH